MINTNLIIVKPKNDKSINYLRCPYITVTAGV